MRVIVVGISSASRWRRGDKLFLPHDIGGAVVLMDFGAGVEPGAPRRRAEGGTPWAPQSHPPNRHITRYLYRIFYRSSEQ